MDLDLVFVSKKVKNTKAIPKNQCLKLAQKYFFWYNRGCENPDPVFQAFVLVLLVPAYSRSFDSNPGWRGWDFSDRSHYSVLCGQLDPEKNLD